MEEYNIYAGLGSSFGGAVYQGTVLAKSYEEAEEYAYQLAVEEYQSYEGLHGIKSWEDIEEELGPDCDEDTISEAYNDEIDTWTDYYAVLTSEDEIPEEDLIRDHCLY